MGDRGGVTLGQLVTTRNTALMSSDPVCGPANACPAEFAANTGGANYDGGKLAQGGGAAGSNNPDLLGAPVSIDGASAPSIPDPSAGKPVSAGECAQALEACKHERAADRADLDQQQGVLAELSGSLKGACGDPCNCTPCSQVQTRIASLCQGAVADDVGRLSAPCRLPAGCAVPAAAPAGVLPGACDPRGQGVQACGCGNVMCDARCLLGL